MPKLKDGTNATGFSTVVGARCPNILTSRQAAVLSRAKFREAETKINKVLQVQLLNIKAVVSRFFPSLL
jgi:hypothetical protein